MKKRLRKKLGVGEFVELGFEVKWQVWPDMYEGSSVYDKMFSVDYEFGPLIEGLGLYLWGWGEERWMVHFLNWAGRGSATEEQRQRVDEWLSHRPEVSCYVVGPLQDARQYSPNIS